MNGDDWSVVLLYLLFPQSEVGDEWYVKHFFDHKLILLRIHHLEEAIFRDDRREAGTFYVIPRHLARAAASLRPQLLVGNSNLNWSPDLGKALVMLISNSVQFEDTLIIAISCRR